MRHRMRAMLEMQGSQVMQVIQVSLAHLWVDFQVIVYGQITGKMFDHPIEKDCVSDLSDPGSCRIGPVREVAGPENAAI